MPIRYFAPAALAIAVLAWPARGDTPAGLTPDQRDRIDRDVKELGARIDALRRPAKPPARDVTGFLPDAEVFRKAVVWALRYEPRLEPADVALIQKALKRCRERVEALETGKTPWWPRPGKGVRGFISDVDGSVQPYGV